MKKKTGILASAIATTAICSSMVVGATFALFTSNDSVDISVTSGKVSVSAALDESSLVLSSMGKEMTGSAWENGGTASVGEDGGLVLENIMPGDKAEFSISLKNESNVAVQYRVGVHRPEGALGDELRIGMSGADFGKWKLLAANEVLSDKINVSVELPTTAGNECQDQSGTLRFTVEAVQGNAQVEDDTFVTATDDARANGTKLKEVVLNAEEGDTIYVTSGVYDIPYATDSESLCGYLPITAKGVSLIGVGKAVLTSADYTPNGIMDTQQLIAIGADDVTLDGFTVENKMDGNKAILVKGQNSALKNINVKCNAILSHESYLEQKNPASDMFDYWEFYRDSFSGSIYYDGEIGNAVLENVSIDRAWLSTGYATGSIQAKNVVIDYVGCGYSSEAGYGPVSANAKTMFAGAQGFEIKVDDTFAGMQELLNSLPAGSTVTFAEGEYNLTTLEVTDSVTLKGAGAGKTVFSFNECYGIRILSDIAEFNIEGITVRGIGSDGTEGKAAFGLGTFKDSKKNVYVGVDKLTVTDCVFEGFDYGLYFGNNEANPVALSIEMTGTTVQNCSNKAMYLETLTNSSFTDCKFINNGHVKSTTPAHFATWVCGVDVNLKYGNYSNIAFEKCAFEGNGENNGGALMIKARDDGSYANNPATLDGVSVKDCTFSKNNTGKDIVLGEIGKGNKTPTNVVIEGCGEAVVVDNRANQ